ncbi:acyltransferase family protein, partial [Alteromonas sp. AMM-1]|uniref:acyltransferase family protein n=1 Tax=Alteromonas sp. AMM-1 TaxID=3394233 RepID=UPI0039A48FA3
MQAIGFRSDINFLRAIAVILVVVFHFSNTLLPGGFVGVDIFFAISGYLMTGIIFSQIQANTFSLISFYLARAKRIIPALAFMVLCVLLYAWFYLYDVEFINLLKHAFSSLLFYSNVVYWQEAGYFSASSHQNWLLHTWSLSVEWQFYIVYPIILLALTRIVGLRWTKLLVIVGAIASFAASVYASNIWPDPAYFSLPTRAWQMMVGGIAFLFPVALSATNKKAISLLGLSFMLLSAIWVSSEMAWPAWPSILPILGAYLFLIANASNQVSLYNTAIFTFTGRWSYSIYLWHWPVVVWMNNQSFAIDMWVIGMGIALSVLLGALSFRAIEQRRAPLLYIVVFSTTTFFAATAHNVGLGSQSYRAISHSTGN